MTLISPGSAGFGAFSVDAETGEVRYDPQGNGGGWAEGVTQTRLRGVVRDQGTGALWMGDVAQVAVTRADAVDPLAAIWAVPGTQGGFVSFDPADYAPGTGLWQDSARTIPTGVGQPIGFIDPLHGTLSIRQDNPAARMTLGDNRLIASGSGWARQPTPGYSLQQLAYCFCVEQTSATNYEGIVSFAPLTGWDHDSADGLANDTGNAALRLAVTARGLSATAFGSGRTLPVVYTVIIDGDTTTIMSDDVVTHTYVRPLPLATAHTGDLVVATRALNNAPAAPYLVGALHAGLGIVSGRIPDADEMAVLRAAVATRRRL